MKNTKDRITLEEGIEKEWVITNGIGGFASSTSLGINTRKYHGLLIAPLTPPARRYLILSKVDESIEIEGKKYDIFSNMCENHISKGYEYQTKFEKEYVPVFTYCVEGVDIVKTICMEYGKDTVGILYKIKTGEKPVKLTLAPIINFRDFHTMNTDHQFDIKQQIKGKKVRIVVDDKIQYPVYMHVSEGTYIQHVNDTFAHMFYIEEQKRGFYPEENHAVPGRFEVEIPEHTTKEISFVCSFEENIEEIDVAKLIYKEKRRLQGIVNHVGDLEKTEEEKKLLKTLIMAADSFIAYRPTFRLHTIIAGYPWFLDWGRDSLISFEGLLLKTKRYDIAKEVLLTMVRDIKYGLVPNGYSGFDNRPLYNSVDASLLLFEQVQKYLEYTGDKDFIETEIFEKLQIVLENYMTGIDVDNNNIYLDTDHLIVSGTQTTQNTWMDAKIGDYAVTPRNGKAVEINAMWYNSLKIMEQLCKTFNQPTLAKKYAKQAKETKKAFEEKFYNARRKCLYDVLGDSKIRPNQLFSLSLTYPVIDPGSEIAENIIETVEKKLWTPYGLQTLAKGEAGYVSVYEGDPKQRDMSYHQGITWPWLLGLYYDSLRNLEKAQKGKKKKEKWNNKIQELKENVLETFSKEVTQRGCIGSIAEIYDSTKPYLPKGAISQAWSVAEILRILM